LKSHLCSGLIDSGANLSLFRGFKKIKVEVKVEKLEKEIH
jgi:hypothetical protein